MRRFTLLCLGAAAAAASGALAQETPSPRGETPRNRLGDSQSPWLRAAADDPIAWLPWGPDAFALARALDRPVLLDIGASWCHFCRVMDEETYVHPEIVAIVNRSFVAVKVDRDERPDVDRTYQDAMNVLTGEGGWPLTVFLTSDGRPFFGGTYFPPDDRDGKPGLTGVLTRVLDLHEKQRDALLDGADELAERLAALEEATSQKGEPSRILLDTLANEIRREFDAEHGGFGKEEGPKYLLTAPIELALALGFERRDGKLLDTATKTLEAASNGGIHDVVGGGFHRYAIGRDWRVPHFEKLAAENAAILSASIHAFGASGGKAAFRDLAADVVAFLEETLSDRERGGFYSSQAADAAPGDDGAYFTWRKSEIEAALVSTSEEYRLFTALYRVADQPRDVVSHPDRNVLARTATAGAVAQRFGLEPAHVAAAERAAIRKLRARRADRRAPPVDTTVYLSVNALAASAFLEAAPLLARDDLRDFALRSLGRALREGAAPNGGLRHAIGAPGAAPIPGFLDDYVATSLACLAAHEATGDAQWLRESKRILDVAIARFEDRERGGFFDSEALPPDAGPEHPARKRGLGEATHPGGSPLAALACLRLAAATGDDAYRARARRALEAFAGSIPIFGYSAGTYGQALRELLEPPPHVVIVGGIGSPATEALRRAAVETYRPGRLVTIHAPDSHPPRPPAEDGSALAYVCAGTTCAPPARDPAALRDTLAAFGRKKNERP